MIEQGRFGAAIEQEEFECISIAQDAIHRHTKALVAGWVSMGD
jgi:hypothetical protein